MRYFIPINNNDELNIIVNFIKHNIDNNCLISDLNVKHISINLEINDYGYGSSNKKHHYNDYNNYSLMSVSDFITKNRLNKLNNIL